jgi:hypothetical protein
MAGAGKYYNLNLRIFETYLLKTGRNRDLLGNDVYIIVGIRSNRTKIGGFDWHNRRKQL